MEIADKIKKIRQVCCSDNNNEFAFKLGYTKQMASGLCGGHIKAGDRIQRHILEVFNEINPSWLLLDEGEMLRSSTNSVTQTNNGSVHGDMVAQAGSQTTTTPKSLVEEENKMLRQQVSQLTASLHAVSSALASMQASSEEIKSLLIQYIQSHNNE